MNSRLIFPKQKRKLSWRSRSVCLVLTILHGTTESLKSEVKKRRFTKQLILSVGVGWCLRYRRYSHAAFLRETYKVEIKMRLHPEKAAEPTTLLKCLTFKALSVHSNQWTKGEVLNALLHLGQSFHDHVFNNVCRNKIIALLDNHNVRFSELHNPHTIAAILGTNPDTRTTSSRDCMRKKAWCRWRLTSKPTGCST